MKESNQILYYFTIFEKDWNDISDYTYYHSFQEACEQAILKVIELIKNLKEKQNDDKGSVHNR